MCVNEFCQNHCSGIKRKTQTLVVEKEAYNGNKKKRQVLAVERKDKYQVRWGEDIEGDNRPPAEAVSAVS